MNQCEVIFVLNDGTEIIGKGDIEKSIYLFPPNILEIVRPYHDDAQKKTTDWNNSIIKVYQDGTIETKLNIPQKESFHLD